MKEHGLEAAAWYVAGKPDMTELGFHYWLFILAAAKICDGLEPIMGRRPEVSFS